MAHKAVISLHGHTNKELVTLELLSTTVHKNRTSTHRPRWIPQSLLNFNQCATGFPWSNLTGKTQIQFGLCECRSLPTATV